MVKIQIKSIFGNVIFEHEKENNTIKDTINKAVKESADLRSADLGSANLAYADLRYANLAYADLRYADLRSADLESADLRHANLESADLESSNLEYADLRYANLEYSDLRHAKLGSADLRHASLNDRIIQISRIGSRNGMTTYNFDKDIIWCGCFTGTLDEFEKQVNETHKENPQYLKEYVGFINYLKSLK